MKNAGLHHLRCKKVFSPHGLPKHTSEEEKSFSRFALKVSLNFTPSNNSKSAARRQVQPN
jgi:hypothetical protein